MTTGLTDIDQVKNAQAQDRSWDALAKTSGDDFAVLTMLFLMHAASYMQAMLASSRLKYLR